MDGQADRFRELYDDHHDRIRRLMARAVGRDAAEDLTQTVFAKAHEALPAFRGDCAPASWLHRIAINVACDWWRARRRELAAACQARDDATEVPTPEQAFSAAQAAAFIRAAISELPARHRDILMLRDIGGLSDEDTAAALGVTPGHARVLLHRARKALMDVVGPRCAEFSTLLSCRAAAPDCCQSATPAPPAGPSAL